jgi:uncharacterized glyoxalase superfamily protein PhnB
MSQWTGQPYEWGTFFSMRFGMVADKFGVGWMVVVAN